MKTTKEMIEVMQAFERGEQIQVKTTNKKMRLGGLKRAQSAVEFLRLPC